MHDAFEFPLDEASSKSQPLNALEMLNSIYNKPPEGRRWRLLRLKLDALQALCRIKMSRPDENFQKKKKGELVDLLLESVCIHHMPL